VVISKTNLKFTLKCILENRIVFMKNPLWGGKIMQDPPVGNPKDEASPVKTKRALNTAVELNVPKSFFLLLFQRR
jgi:hypothetical protein